VFCIRRAHDVTGPFLFQEKTVKSTNHLNVLVLFAVPQMAHLQPNIFFQQDGAPPDWGPIVREFSKQTDWVGRTNPLAPSLPRYRVATTRYFVPKLEVRLNFVHEPAIQLLL
jgi:hypothetical protein